MKFTADIHLHSHYSRATSKNLNFEHLYKWAQLKGINVVGTGDIAHPGWLQEMRDKLEPAEDGLFRLKDEFAKAIQPEIPAACRGTVRFMLAGEISNIYKKNDKVRKIHTVVFMPTFEAVEKLQVELEKIGNIRSDGRPILGLDVRDLFEIVLENDPQGYMIPAHIWTPWFSLFGSMSGFDTIEECFEGLTPHIFALETGLSSDPPMNWRLSALDKYTLVSNSDAHSPQKLAREANLFDTELSYPSIFSALKTGNPDEFLGTIEFFPEEGKYHYDGHRKCGVCWNPATTLAHDKRCPECGKPVTIGVMHRVETLADRPEGERPEKVQPYYSLIPLPEVISEIVGVGPNSKRVLGQYDQLLAKLGSELYILREAPLEDIEKSAGATLAEGIRRMRAGEIEPAAGFDGEFGVIKLFKDNDAKTFAPQLDLFGSKKREQQSEPPQEKPPQHSQQTASIQEPAAPDFPETDNQVESPAKPPAPVEESDPHEEVLNESQQRAASCVTAPLIIAAGPGTGKTRTLTFRIANLIENHQISPEHILAVTFTNKAAEEMSLRLQALLGEEISRQVTVKTFHAFGMMLLHANYQEAGQQNVSILAEDQRRTLMKDIFPKFGRRKIDQHLVAISRAKNQLLTPQSPELSSLIAHDGNFPAIFDQYEKALQKNRSLDFDDLIVKAIHLLENDPAVRQKYQQRFRWISVDEYQDINDVQYRLLKRLTGPETNLCVIGDPDQAIYGFRGANRAYFLKFREDFTGAQIIHLAQIYRSSQNILSASKQIIGKSSDDRQHIDIWSEIVSKTRIEVYRPATQKAEAEYIVHQIEKMVGGTSYFSLDSGRVNTDDEQQSRAFGDFAVLYRLGAQNAELLEAFQRSGIPFQTVGQTPFFEQNDIQELMTYLHYIHNPKSVFLLKKFDANAERIIPLLEELRWSYEAKTVTALLKRMNDFLTKNTIVPDSRARKDLFRKLSSKAAVYKNDLAGFLESAALQKEADEYDPRADRVTLMTLHAAKGLEFPVVFIAGCEESLIPFQRKGKAFDVEEERRLFYVGMTRAREQLILLHTANRFLFGKRQQNMPSRFLHDIEQALKEFKAMPALKRLKKDDVEDKQLRLF